MQKTKNYVYITKKTKYEQNICFSVRNWKMVVGKAFSSEEWDLIATNKSKTLRTVFPIVTSSDCFVLTVQAKNIVHT